ncbi:MAG: LysM peptidoglycan-binding domain-containing protein [Desulfitobacteriaceae bacterium]
MPALKLGTIEFAVDDLPEEIDLGGSHALAIRKFPGGGLDVQALGAFDDPIYWEAVFMYSNALDRALAIDAMRIKGAAVTLVIGSISRSVVINKFTYKIQNDTRVPYTIDLQPLTAYGSDVTVNGLPELVQTTSTTTTPPSTPSQTPQRTYTVVAGDTLWGIAAKPEFYNDGSQFPKIADANSSIIPDPNLIYPGQILVIP